MIVSGLAGDGPRQLAHAVARPWGTRDFVRRITKRAFVVRLQLELIHREDGHELATPAIREWVVPFVCVLLSSKATVYAAVTVYMTTGQATQKGKHIESSVRILACADLTAANINSKHI